MKLKYVSQLQQAHLHTLLTYLRCYFKWVTHNCRLNLHSRMDLNGASGLRHPIGANLYSVVTERWHPSQPIYLRKQVNSGYAIVLWNTKQNKERISNFSFENSYLQMPWAFIRCFLYLIYLSIKLFIQKKQKTYQMLFKHKQPYKNLHINKIQSKIVKIMVLKIVWWNNKV